MLQIKDAVVVVVLIFLKHNNGLGGQVISSFQLWQIDSTIDNFQKLLPFQEVIHDKIMLNACFQSCLILVSTMKNMLVYEYVGIILELC